MKRTAIISLFVVFLSIQYTYTLASYDICEVLDSIEPLEFIESVSRPEVEAVEGMFLELELTESIDLIDYDNTYSLEFENIEWTLVPLYDDSILMFTEKENTLIGAIDLSVGEYNVIISQNIQPNNLCGVFCILFFGGYAFSVIACVGLPLGLILLPFGLLDFNFLALGIIILIFSSPVCLWGIGGLALISLCMSIC